MNQVAIVGNLCREVNLHEGGETPFCNLTVAVDDGYGEKKTTSFIPVKVFGKAAENCARYLSKGRKVAVTGRIQTGSYEKDGRTIYTTDVIAFNVEFLSKASDSPEEDIPNDHDVPEGFENVDEDIPF